MRDPKAGHVIAIASLLVTPFVALFLIGVATAEPSKDGTNYLPTAILLSVIAATWVIAALVLWSAWWARTRLVDGPELLLTVASSLLPLDRREWGEAMRSELSLIEDRSARWQFAIGGARAVLLPPQTDPLPVRVAGLIAAAAVVAIWFASGVLTPSLRVLVVTLAALIGLMTTMAVARGWLRRDKEPIHPISVIGIAAVVASVWLTGAFLARFPEAEEQFSTSGAVVLAIGMASIVWLAGARPQAMMRSRRAVTIGMWSGILLGAGYWVTARTVEAGTMSWAVLAPWLIMAVAGAAAAMSEGSLWAGVRATVWAASLGTTLMFAVALPEAVRRYGRGDGLLLDGDWAPIGTNLNDAIWILIAVPVLGLPLGVFGAAIGRRIRRRRLPIASFAQIKAE
jgi:hypothetical protein